MQNRKVILPSVDSYSPSSPVRCLSWPCTQDDLGHGGIQSNNPLVKGPRVDELRDEGLYLSRHYVYKFCSPTRGSFLSGRYPFRTGNTRSNFIPWSRPDGLELGFDTLPLRLGRLGYSTHHVGKWQYVRHPQPALQNNVGCLPLSHTFSQPVMPRVFTV